jgi:MFS transporter, PPP family, 3-phenylpropionic acid transporter
MDVKQPEKTYRFFQSFYFLVFFAHGAVFPLLSIYLEAQMGLNNTQIGLIVSIIPMVTIFGQPMWGVLSDITGRPRLLLLIAVLAGGVTTLLYTWLSGFFVLFLGMIGIAIFQSAVVPLSDSLTLSFAQTYQKEYGNIRLWGSLGFAIAVFLLGQITENLNDTTWIFYAFALGYFLSALSLIPFPKRGHGVHVDFRSGMNTLMRNKTFIMFLSANFLIFGPVLANNYYFGKFILSVGGTLAGVGVAFLIAAGSEAPFMKYAQKIIDRFDPLLVLLICTIVSGVRWIFYAFDPSVTWIYATTIIQGISVGLYVPAALLFVRQVASKQVQATAVGLYSAVGNGMGNAFFTFLGGLLIDLWNVNGMYVLFSAMTLVGLAIISVIKRQYEFRTSLNFSQT